MCGMASFLDSLIMKDKLKILSLTKAFHRYIGKFLYLFTCQPKFKTSFNLAKRDKVLQQFEKNYLWDLSHFYVSLNLNNRMM